MIKKQTYHPTSALQKRNIIAWIVAVGLILFSGAASANNSIVVIYSGAGKSEIIAKAVSKSLEAEILEIKNLKQDKGYFSRKLDEWFNRQTPIEPENPDLEQYQVFVIVSPVKKWELSPLIRTMMEKNSLEDRMLFMVTYSEKDVKRYDTYTDDASYWKRSKRNKIRKWRAKSMKIAKESGAIILGHYHIATKGKSDEELDAVARAIFDDLGKDMPQWLFKSKDLPLWMLPAGTLPGQ